MGVCGEHTHSWKRGDDMDTRDHDHLHDDHTVGDEHVTAGKLASEGVGGAAAGAAGAAIGALAGPIGYVRRRARRRGGWLVGRKGRE